MDVFLEKSIDLVFYFRQILILFSCHFSKNSLKKQAVTGSWKVDMDQEKNSLRKSPPQISGGDFFLSYPPRRIP